MSEENTEVVEVKVKEVSTENTESKETELSDVEKRALEMGWRPREEFDGEDSDFIDAKEFVSRRPLFDKIERQSHEIKEVRKALKALTEHHQKVKEAEFKNAIEFLKSEKKKALEDGDADRLIEIDDKIAEAKAKEIVANKEQATQAQTPHPNFVQWVQDNPWYVSDNELRMVADQIGTSYAASNPEVAPDEVLQYVKRRVKKLYPEKFTNPNRERPSAVEGSSTAPTRDSKSRDTFELTEDEKRVMNTFVRAGILTKEQYIADLKKIKGA